MRLHQPHISGALGVSHSRFGPPALSFFFFNDTATTEIYTLSLHDALPISWRTLSGQPARHCSRAWPPCTQSRPDRKSTRLNSSHVRISYAVFCLKKKTSNTNIYTKAPTTHSTPPSPRLAPPAPRPTSPPNF